jgi:allophanate hydrolase
LAAQAWLFKPEAALPATGSGALQAMRFAVKDNVDVCGWPTTAACPAFGYTAAQSATVVRRLLQAGASLVGKTNMDQFACGLNGTRSPYGAVPNSFDARLVSGGSSSGSAYVVATGQVDFSLGTDTAGSGRVPAGLNNIVGLKPSKGLVSCHGVVPAAQSVDCVSIFALTVPQAVDVLRVLAAHDPADPYSRQIALNTTALPAQFRFGLPEPLEFYGDTQAEAEFASAVKRLQSLGGTAVSVDYRPLQEAASLLYESALVAERYSAVQGFFDAHEADVIEPVRSILAAGRRYSAADLFNAQTRLRACAQQVAHLWQQVDVLLVPTAPTHYSIADMQSDPVALNRNLGHYTNFVNLLDYAALSVPSSLRPDGLPFGITLIGPCGSDLQLAELGQRYHQASGLTLGATGQPLPPAQPIAGMQPATPEVLHLAVVGAHLSGMPLNHQLIDGGAVLLQATQTAARYRLFALSGTRPPKPGLQRVAEQGAAIAVEVWAIPLAALGRFLAQIPAPLGLGQLELADGRWVHGFICEGYATAGESGALDITHHGGWRNYLATLSKS